MSDWGTAWGRLLHYLTTVHGMSDVNSRATNYADLGARAWFTGSELVDEIPEYTRRRIVRSRLAPPNGWTRDQVADVVVAWFHQYDPDDPATWCPGGKPLGSLPIAARPAPVPLTAKAYNRAAVRGGRISDVRINRGPGSGVPKPTVSDIGWDHAN